MPSLDAHGAPLSPIYVEQRQQHMARSALLQVYLLGLFSALLYLLLYALLLHRTAANDPVLVSWETTLPWMMSLYHQFARLSLPVAIPASAQFIQHSYLLPALLCVVLVSFFAIAFISRHISKGNLTHRQLYPSYLMLFFITLLLALLMICAPIRLDALSLEMLQSGFYGRVVALYHVNPYLPLGSVGGNDPLFHLLTQLTHTDSDTLLLPPSGPIWLDISILISLFAHSNVALMLLGFRLLGMSFHLLNTVLLWFVLARQRPAQRITIMLLYAWNPLSLLLGISFFHADIIAICFLFLTIIALQHDSMLLGWVFLLLASLINMNIFIVVPVFLILFVRQKRYLPAVWRSLWWTGLLFVTLLVLFLAYLPYWTDSGTGISGIANTLLQTFRPAIAFHSFDAAILNLPIKQISMVSWLFTPLHWGIFTLIILLIGFLFAFWFADTVETTIICASWLLLLWTVLQAVYCPWFILIPFALTLCSTRLAPILCALLLGVGALASYYLLQVQIDWSEQGLITISIPFLCWGWMLFFILLWQWIQGWNKAPAEDSRPQHLIRPPWLSRPSVWSSRFGHRNRH
ncbi:MAG TPA: hypothetical protein VL461_05140 [Dictyobacter sp.]|nr:hypothetical protein [Dictyobacter sp.]